MTASWKPSNAGVRHRQHKGPQYHILKSSNQRNINATSCLMAVISAAIAAWTFRGALGYGFSQDDFLGLARATGHAARLPLGWRWLSHQLWWDVIASGFGSRATAAHALSLAAHALVAAVLAWLLARRLPVPAALAGAAFVASHPSAYTAVYWASANGDLLAALFALATLGCAFSPRARWLAVPCFALALLAKESVILLPIAWAAIALWGAGSRVSVRELSRDRVWWACVALAVLAVAASQLGPHPASLGGEAYALSLRAIPDNVLSYDGWAVNRWLASTAAFKDGVDSGVFGWGVALNVIWIAGCFVPALRGAGWIAAGVAWCAMLAPVLPLANHTYHYYLYAGLPAAGLMIAALVALASARLPRAAAWALAVAFSAFCAIDGHALVSKIEQAPFIVAGLRSDAIVDRARIAMIAIDDLRAAHLPAGTRLEMWSPQSQAMAAADGVPAGKESYFETNVRAALLDGLALRVTVPNVDSVTFARSFDASDSLARWAVYRYDGHLRAFRARELARVLAAGPPGH
jgi:hypothetical protein